MLSFNVTDMNVSGGGLLLLAAAALWIAYLLPTLVHRAREGAGSRVRYGSASARKAAKAELLAQRLAQKQQHRAELERHRDLALAEAERKAAERAALTAERSAKKGLSLAQTRQRLRLARTGASGLVVVGLAGIAVGVIGPGMNLIVWVGQLLVASGTVLAAIGLVIALNRTRALDALAGVGQAVPSAVAPPATAPTVTSAPRATAPARNATWTPRSLPAPMHLADGSSAARTIAAQQSLAELRRRALELSAESASRHGAPTSLERARRAAAARTAAPAASAVASSASAPAATSRFAQMGIVEGAEAQLDVTAILQNRRAV